MAWKNKNEKYPAIFQFILLNCSKAALSLIFTFFSQIVGTSSCQFENEFICSLSSAKPRLNKYTVNNTAMKERNPSHFGNEIRIEACNFHQFQQNTPKCSSLLYCCMCVLWPRKDYVWTMFSCIFKVSPLPLFLLFFINEGNYHVLLTSIQLCLSGLAYMIYTTILAVSPHIL